METKRKVQKLSNSRFLDHLFSQQKLPIQKSVKSDRKLTREDSQRHEGESTIFRIQNGSEMTKKEQSSGFSQTPFSKQVTDPRVTGRK